MMKTLKTILTTAGFAMLFALSINAQSVNLTALDGGKVDVTAQRGKVVVLAVGATWLPLSKDQAIVTNKLAKKYAGRDVLIYFVATDSANAKSKNYASDDQIRAFATKNKVTSPVLRDSDGLLTLKRFSIDQLPSFVILDKNGKASGDPFGGIDPDNDVSIAISKTIDKLL